MGKAPLKYWSAVPALTVGAFFGLLVLISLRVEYYGLMEYRPNMAPQIAYYFSPILLAEILLVALPLEVLFRRYWHTPYTHLQASLIGVSYASLLTWWAFPGHWAIFLGLNPLIIRGLVGLIFAQKEDTPPTIP